VGTDETAVTDGAAGDAQERRARLEEVARRLERAHGPPSRPRRDPLEELVLTILSQNTSDTNRDRAWERLRDRFDDWDDVRRAEPAELEEALRPGGLAGQKASAVQGLLEDLRRERGEISLDHLGEMDDAEAMDYLTSFRRVGTKTAACVLCFALRRPVMPVDTHVDRVSRRLGLVPGGGGAAAAHRVLNEIVPPERRFPLHIQMIRHGREVCSARSPACEECPLEDVCPRVGVGEAA
jgi:endonuclease-3